MHLLSNVTVCSVKNIFEDLIVCINYRLHNYHDFRMICFDQLYTRYTSDTRHVNVHQYNMRLVLFNVFHYFGAIRIVRHA
jgi:hypothetical protein